MLARFSNAIMTDLGLFVIRTIIGLVFMFHGAQKLFGAFDGPGLAGFTQMLAQLGVPYPQYGAVAAASAEFFGGIAFVLGMWTKVAALPLVITMGVAVYFVHPTAFSLQAQGMEYALTLGLVALGIGLTGPGRVSLEWLFRLRDTVVDSELSS